MTRGDVTSASGGKTGPVAAVHLATWYVNIRDECSSISINQLAGSFEKLT